ncbi:hypothetical protein C5167_026735 [Papaver somniferum]|nr:hypothetical protein C5167_026735 [Papaver somniferum]
MLMSLVPCYRTSILVCKEWEAESGQGITYMGRERSGYWLPRSFPSCRKPPSMAFKVCFDGCHEFV